MTVAHVEMYAAQVEFCDSKIAYHGGEVARGDAAAISLPWNQRKLEHWTRERDVAVSKHAEALAALAGRS